MMYHTVFEPQYRAQRLLSLLLKYLQILGFSSMTTRNHYSQKNATTTVQYNNFNFTFFNVVYLNIPLPCAPTNYECVTVFHLPIFYHISYTNILQYVSITTGWERWAKASLWLSRCWFLKAGAKRFCFARRSSLFLFSRCIFSTLSCVCTSFRVFNFLLNLE